MHAVTQDLHTMTESIIDLSKDNPHQPSKTLFGRLHAIINKVDSFHHLLHTIHDLKHTIPDAKKALLAKEYIAVM
jgi:hypothetical protein